MSGMSYEQAGVNYDVLDSFKRACQREAGGTRDALRAHGLHEPAGIRGESAYLIETPNEYLAHVEEGLGTKNLVADAMGELTGRTFYRAIGIDTVATMVNDLITCGALPISVAMHAAVGDADFFRDAKRAEELARGFAEGCRQAGAVWGGGETPALRDIVNPQSIVLAGSVLGRISPKANRIGGAPRDGDAIVFLASSGVHTNGLTLCRQLASRLPRGYLTPMRNGRSYGEALLDASVIYVNFVAACQRAGLDLHYVAHVTGHGWRKLMRADSPLVYRIEKLPPVPEVFRFIMEHGPVEMREAYATFNMGVGFAAYVSQKDAQRCAALAVDHGYEAMIAGRAVSEGSRKAVEIVPLGIVFEGETLNLR